MQLLRTILIILFVWYGFKILSRLFGPYLFKYASKKMEKKFGEQFGQQQQQHKQAQQYREGETVIDKKPQNTDSKKSSEKVGEYIEFEEID
ncbi:MULTISPECIES: DUF4834 family protein [Galbibacter]|uniref:DUF4834 family protein n=1 Tax=Galbibacter pacificus TaxID=2996052 RepID=A0ABT6FR78_9FLAO|nr:DUF4834 family protein [Galbibacter pacificus]MDG3581920.1 DUF4834 family protein [Galbibacter pacificus]MDG3585606.1 DUF4834 family protein [Galbibacter pacificus]